MRYIVTGVFYWLSKRVHFSRHAASFLRCHACAFFEFATCFFFRFTLQLSCSFIPRRAFFGSGGFGHNVSLLIAHFAFSAPRFAFSAASRFQPFSRPRVQLSPGASRLACSSAHDGLLFRFTLRLLFRAVRSASCDAFRRAALLAPDLYRFTFSTGYRNIFRCCAFTLQRRLWDQKPLRGSGAPVKVLARCSRQHFPDTCISKPLRTKVSTETRLCGQRFRVTSVMLFLPATVYYASSPNQQILRAAIIATGFSSVNPSGYQPDHHRRSARSSQRTNTTSRQFESHDAI